MSPWIEAAFAKYAWIWIGLTFGLAAKYALLIKKGVKVRPSLLMADILLLPMVGLIAYWLVTQFGVSGEAAALVSAGATIGAERVVKLYTERFMRQVEAITLRDLSREVTESKGELRNAVQTELSAKRLAGQPED